MMNLEQLTLDNPLWRFSLQQWQHQPLQEQLLALQNKKSVRINLILVAIWLSFEHKDIRPYRAGLIKHTEEWHNQIVAPIRKVRQNLPSNMPKLAPSLKNQIQSCELQAEQVEQALLFEASHKIPSETGIKKDSLDWLIINLRASHIEESDLFLLVRNCLPNYPENRIRDRLQRA